MQPLRRQCAAAPSRTLPPLLLVLIACGAPLNVQAQEPPDSTPPQNVPALDTVMVRADSAAADTLNAAADSVASDSIMPAPHLVEFRSTEPAGWSSGTWEWDREALLESSAFTLVDLLERLPGLTAIRSGWYGMPQTIAAYGAAGGGIHVVMDSYAFDPLGTSAPDLSAIALADLERVRVERRAGGLRIEVETLAPSDGRPYSMIQAAQGDRLETQLFRGIFMAPRVFGGPLSLGVERMDTRGLNSQQPAVAFDGWFTWGLMRDSLGVQLGYYRSSISRGAEGPFPADGTRQDWTLRVRGAPVPGLTAEAFAGLSSLEGIGVIPGTAAASDSVRPTRRVESVQAGVRTQYRADDWWTGASFRARDHNSLPELAASFDAGFRLPAHLRLSGGIHWEAWDQGEHGLAFRTRAAWRPFTGANLFASYASSRTGVPFTDYATGAPRFTESERLRVGAAYANGGFQAGAAYLYLAADSVAPFRLPFDVGLRGLMGGAEVSGFEARLRLPILWEPLSVNATYTEWFRGRLWPYLPVRSWRAALTYHGRPLDSADFEVIARLERQSRGSMIVPAVDGELATVPSRAAFDFYFQLRINSFRAFLRWDNMLHKVDLHDLPARPLPGQRLIYGVKWSFWN